MDEKQGDGILSLRPFMDKVDFQPFNYGRVVVESVESLSNTLSLAGCKDTLIQVLLLTFPVKAV
jgi:hypothetical protein